MSNPTSTRLRTGPSHSRDDDDAQHSHELQPLCPNDIETPGEGSLLSELEQPQDRERDLGQFHQDSVSQRSSALTATTSGEDSAQFDMADEQVSTTMENGPPAVSTSLSNLRPDGSHPTTATTTPSGPSGQTGIIDESCCRRYLQPIQRWVAEWHSCAFAVASIAAIVMLVALRQNKPIPHWRANITMNALLSLFLVLLKAALALPLSEGINQPKRNASREHPRPFIDMEDIDSAIRGAWGSFQFMFKLDKEELGPSSSWSRNTAHYMTKLAILLVILACSADPFVQQIVQYNPYPQKSTSLIANLPRTRFFGLRGSRQGPGLEYVQAPVQVAIQRAMYDPPTNPASLVSATCKSGNCSFPLFSTLGFCHSCEDISSNVRNVTNSTWPVFNLTIGDDENDLSVGEDPNGFAYFMAAGKTSGSIANISSPSWTVSMLSRAIINGEPSGNARPSAFKCDLTPCVRTLQSTMSNNVLTEKLVSSTPFTGMPTSAISSTSDYFSFATKRILDIQGVWSECTPLDAAPVDDNTYSAVYQVNVEGATIPPPDMISTSYKWVPNKCIFTMGVTPLHSIHNELTTQFAAITVRESTWFPGGPVLGMTLWQNGTGDLDSTNAVMDTLANALTNALRQNGEEGTAAYIEGTVMIEDTCADVDRLWASFLFVLMKLALLFLLVMCFKARKTHDARIMKSSCLLVLRCVLEDKVGDLLGKKLTRDSIMEKARQLRVELQQDDEGKPIYVLTT